MNRTVGFRNLPFEPVKEQVIYVERVFDAEVNAFISNNFKKLKRYFSNDGKELVYMPMLKAELETQVKYHAPYLSDSTIVENIPGSDYIIQFLDDESKERLTSPAFLTYDHDENGCCIFDVQEIDLSELQELIEPKPSALSNDSVRFSISSGSREDLFGLPMESVCKGKKYVLNDDDIMYRIGLEEPPMHNVVEPYEDDELDKDMKDLNNVVERMRLKGISLAAIHEMIDKNEKLSRLVITPDNRIFLPDYNNQEVVMSYAPKALFFLFLRYPEGIRLCELQDHYTELYNTYCELRPRYIEEKVRVTITELVNPIGNSVNENMSRIKTAFVKLFDERLAKNYFITGTKGEEYRITLDRNLVVWEECGLCVPREKIQVKPKFVK